MNFFAGALFHIKVVKVFIVVQGAVDLETEHTVWTASCHGNFLTYFVASSYSLSCRAWSAYLSVAGAEPK